MKHIVSDLNESSPVGPFGKAVLTGVFAGFVATIICLIFNILYRDATGFTLSTIVNVSSLIFGVNLLFLIVGLLYFVFLRIFPKGDIFFIAAFVLLTLFCLLKTDGVQRDPDMLVASEFRHLLSGIILILGGFAAFGIPFFYHSRGFAEHVI